eukprot:8654806-Pyramimonas_sp.AAC.1
MQCSSARFVSFFMRSNVASYYAPAARCPLRWHLHSARQGSHECNYRVIRPRPHPTLRLKIPLPWAPSRRSPLLSASQ